MLFLPVWKEEYRKCYQAQTTNYCIWFGGWRVWRRASNQWGWPIYYKQDSIGSWTSINKVIFPLLLQLGNINFFIILVKYLDKSWKSLPVCHKMTFWNHYILLHSAGLQGLTTMYDKFEAVRKNWKIVQKLI